MVIPVLSVLILGQGLASVSSERSSVFLSQNRPVFLCFDGDAVKVLSGPVKKRP